MENNVAKENNNSKIIKQFVSHGIPVTIRFDDKEYSEAETKDLMAKFLLTLHGIDY